MVNGWERVRIVSYYLGGEELGDGYCDEDCDHCPIRFQCYTTKKESILIMDNPTAKQLHTIQPYFFTLKECRIMRCPHCQSMFKVTYHQLANNTKFRCKVCGRYNQGSSKEDRYGILIGELNADI